jgi:hypothetical protein
MYTCMHRSSLVEEGQAVDLCALDAFPAQARRFQQICPAGLGHGCVWLVPQTFTPNPLPTLLLNPSILFVPKTDFARRTEEYRAR